MSRKIRLLLTALGVLASTPSAAAVIRVCPASLSASTCDFSGDDAIQQAVDRAADGDVIRLAPGIYVPQAYRDVRFQDIVARGYVAIQNKRLVIQGDTGVVLDGKPGVPSIAFVLENADVAFSDLEIRGFSWKEEEDDVYDGHGIFAIDSKVRATNIVMRAIPKMALTGRGRTLIDASGLRLLDGHLGIWLEEAAHAHIRDSVIAGGDSAGVGAYDDSSVHLFNSVIAKNADDGLYAADNATIFADRSIIVGNAPYAINAEAQGKVRVGKSAMHANAAPRNPAVPAGQLAIREDVIHADPLLDPEWRPRSGSPLVAEKSAGDPIGLLGRQP